jgi:hypothetical protein
MGSVQQSECQLGIRDNSWDSCRTARRRQKRCVQITVWSAWQTLFAALQSLSATLFPCGSWLLPLRPAMAPPGRTPRTARSRNISIRSSGIQAIQTGMREEQHQFFRLLNQLPARLTAEQAAWVLNCQPADVPILVGARLLKPLGNPLPNSVKYFGALELVEQVQDRTWLAKVTNALNQHWQKRSAAKKN